MRGGGISMTGKDKAAKKNTSMFDKDGFCAWLENVDKTPICHEQEEDKFIYAFPRYNNR